MTLDQRTREQMLALCGEIHDDDGVDPRKFFKTNRQHRKQDRKARQLCRQVAETLSLVLSGDGRDEILHSLYVDSVEPAPDSSRLLVTVCADLPIEEIDHSSILACLNAHMGRLRFEIATSITRKRVPVLVFNVIGRPDMGEVCQ